MLSRILVCLFLVFSTCAFAETAKPIEYFFEQSATSAVLKPIANKPGTYQLTLNNVRPFIHYISVRPDRVTGIIPIEKFFADWNKGQNAFSTDAPNVTLAGMKLHGTHENKIVSYVFILKNPQYNKNKDTISYEAQILQNQSHVYMSEEIVLENVVLFLDDGWCPGCCCG